MICSFLGLERQLAVEKQTRSNLEQETTSLKKKITLLEYDLQEAKKSLQQTQSSKDKTDQEVEIFCFWKVVFRFFLSLFH